MRLSKQVLQVLKWEAISEAEVMKMVELASPATDSQINRRFHHWGFKYVKDTDTLEAMMLVKHKTVGRGTQEVHEECEHCEGQGCKVCGWRGEIIRRI